MSNLAMSPDGFIANLRDGCDDSVGFSRSGSTDLTFAREGVTAAWGRSAPREPTDGLVDR